MSIKDWLQQAESKLSKAEVSTPKLDCLVLLEDVLGKDRAQLLAHPELQISSEQKDTLESFIARRSKHEPLAYIRGKTEFYGREFIVDKNVLEPRPETETMIELLKKLKPGAIIDVGTGSGAIAITAKFLFPSKEVIAVDIDKKCLEVTKKNAQKHNIQLTILQSDLLENLATMNDMVILANLPYVPDNFAINKAALHEPKLAIFAGMDGLDLYRKLFEQISEREQKPHYILTESLPFQHHALAELARKHGYAQTERKDFIQLFETL